ncbi:hypothetical protein QIA36_05385 (plasmid) [Borreliella yangtzensis]|uniref:hypothetical protein n=1 Tax=Borreliella yangtzensis TaxID=683292 RepID=UPI003BA2BF30
MHNRHDILPVIYFDNKVSDKNSSGTFEQPCDISLLSQHTKCRLNTMSPQVASPVINKANISSIKYKNSKNSNINSKVLKNNLDPEKNDVEDRLIQKRHSKRFPLPSKRS